MIKASAVTYSEHGKPEECLRLVEQEISSPGEGEAIIQMKAAVINPSDFGMIMGVYGNLAELPAVAGREGVAEVIEVGANVTEVTVGDWVRMPTNSGAWQSHLKVPVQDLYSLPKDIPLEMAAMSFVNPPTAWRLLRDAQLDQGDWVIQNAGNSAVGIAVVQMAKHLGFKTLSVVRREECVQPLIEMGADQVVLEDSGYEKKISELTDGGQVRLALNSVGGESAIRLIKTLANGGRHITFGGMAFEPVRFPTRYLIFNDIKLEGFWMDKWYRDQSHERIQIMMNKLFKLMRDGEVTIPIEGRFALKDYAAAIAAAKSPKFGKILFVPEG